MQHSNLHEPILYFLPLFFFILISTDQKIFYSLLLGTVGTEWVQAYKVKSVPAILWWGLIMEEGTHLTISWSASPMSKYLYPIAI